MDESGEYRTYKKQTGPGKGDRNRVSDLQSFRKNFENINWSRGSKPRRPRAYRKPKEVS